MEIALEIIEINGSKISIHCYYDNTVSYGQTDKQRPHSSVNIND